MKRANAILLSVSILVTSVVIANAQGRGRGREHGNVNEKGRHEWKSDNREHDRKNTKDYRRDQYNQHSRYDSHRHSQSDRHDRADSRTIVVHSYPAYSHHHSRDCGHRVLVRHYERPRYIYYRDYNVYYDDYRHVYITLSGRRWIMSAGLPPALHHVDLRRAACHNVDYYDDDFTSYLDLGRPIYR